MDNYDQYRKRLETMVTRKVSLTEDQKLSRDVSVITAEILLEVVNTLEVIHKAAEVRDREHVAREASNKRFVVINTIIQGIMILIAVATLAVAIVALSTR